MRLAPYAAALFAFGALGVSSMAAGAAEGEGPILPGYWESTAKSSFSSAKTERKCISSRAINAYLTGPMNNHYACRYDTRHLVNGEARMEGECVDNNGLKSRINIEGTYGPEAFKLNGHMRIVIGGLPIPVETSIDAHRISGECPAGMKVEDGGGEKVLQPPRKKSRGQDD